MKKDTSPEMAQKYQDLIMALTPQQRLRMCSEMFDTARTLIIAGLTNEPNPQNLTLRSRLFLRLYARDFTPQEQHKITQHLEFSVAGVELRRAGHPRPKNT